ncbi:MAG: hypothetical protein IT539_09930 [Bradyrhizobiaceae bacterium]|nr:hypothetical protein [Bradyrhizobiaceae bacterium]
MEGQVGMFSRRRGTVSVYAADKRASRIATALQRRLPPAPVVSAPATEAEAREGTPPSSSGRFGAPPFRRFYEPRGIRIMTEAIDLACRLLPEKARRNERLRQRLALRIMHGFDAGEADAMRLAASAVLWVRV